MNSSLHHRGWLCAIGAAALFPFAPLAPPLSAQSEAAKPVSARQRDAADNSYLNGAKHLSAHEFTAAEQDFAHAAAANPAKPEYLQALTVAREQHISDLLQRSAQARSTNPKLADALLDQARVLDPDNPRVLQHEGTKPSAIQAPMRRMQPAGVIVLQANDARHSYHERSDLQSFMRHVTSDFGIKVVIDPDTQTKQFRIDIDDVDFKSTMRAINLLTDTMFVPVDQQTIVVASDTTPNRRRYEHLVEETYYLPGISADQIKDYVSIAQNVFSLHQVSVEPGLNAIVMRGPADLVEGANKTFSDLLQGDSDVVIDLKLFSVDKQHVKDLGVVIPSSLNSYSLASEAQSLVNSNQSLVSQLIASGIIPSTTSVYEIAAYLVVSGAVSDSLISNSFLIFGGGATTSAITVGSVPTINLALNNSDARELDDVQLRVGNRQTTTFKAGTRYPIQTSLYSDIATTSTSALAGTTVNGVSLSSLLAQYLGTGSSGSTGIVPQIQYEDLGITVTAVPHIQRTADVGMHLEMKVSSLAGTALNGIPILANRQFSSDLTVHDGDTAMMISNTSKSELSAVTGEPGLGDLPGFQNTTNRDLSVTTGDLVLMITPHIVRKGHTGARGPYIPLAPRPDDD